MHKTYESSRRSGTAAQLLTVKIKGLTRGDIYGGLEEVARKLRRGKKAGAESRDTMAYTFKLTEANR